MRILLISLVASLALASCSKGTPEFVNSIPDDAVAVVSVHPMQLYSKGKISSFESIKEAVKDEIWGQILDNPLSSGLMLDEYVYTFVLMEDEAPVIGMVAGLRDEGKFEKTLGNIEEDGKVDPVEMEGFKYISPDEEGIISWNKEQVLVLASPDGDEFATAHWIAELNSMYNPVKEESITSLVDFKSFLSGMKDINAWLSSDKLREIIEQFAPDKVGNIPVSLHNNYSHIYCDFSNGVMNVTGETNFSDEVQKNLDEFLVMKAELNQDMLNMAPGDNLLLALALSMDLEKMKEMAKKFGADDLGDIGDKVEGLTGVPGEELFAALTGDLTIAVNGLEEEGMIPAEVFIGLGVNTEKIQEQLLENVESMVPVEDQGDFFVINAQGIEVYSGIINGNWIITNVKGYKSKLKNGKLPKSLLESRFADFDDGGMGLFLNLDLYDYPGMARDLLEQNAEQASWIEELAEHFEYMGISGGDNVGLFTLKTNTPNENSLYTLLKIVDESH